MTYSEKLQSPFWQKKRLEVLNRDGFSCQLCSDATNTLHVHHKTYKKNTEPWEYPLSNFITYCKDCHEIVEYFTKLDYHVVSICELPDQVVGQHCAIVSHKNILDDIRFVVLHKSSSGILHSVISLTNKTIGDLNRLMGFTSNWKNG